MTDLYEAFLQRSPDGPGLSFWVSSTQANGRAATLNAFKASTEYQELAGTLYRETFWLVSDHLGTPRMVVYKTGSLAGVKRHDYLPFGEEVGAGVGGRTTSQGYSVADGVRQRFTSKERDVETGLDYFGARYYSSTQGRFTSVDPAAIKQKTLINPQDLNRYAYVANNPLKYIDPTGKEKVEIIVRTFIPYPTITYPPGVGATFNGNVDENGKRKPGREGYKTEQRVTVETDVNKPNSMNFDHSHDVGPTHRIAKGVGNMVGSPNGQADGSTLKESAARNNDNTVTVKMSGNESNPLVTSSPGISFHFSITVQSDGADKNLKVEVNGTHDGFPAYEIEIVRPEAGVDATISIHDPRNTGNTPFSLYPPEDRKVTGRVEIPGKKPQ